MEKNPEKSFVKTFKQCMIEELNEGEYSPHEKEVIKKIVGKAIKNRLSKGTWGVVPR